MENIIEEIEVIKMNNITKIYPMGKSEFIALEDVNVTIKKGEYVAIVGPSGAGKSTLMNIIGCLDTATKGDYVLDGLDTRCWKHILNTSQQNYQEGRSKE
jgi:putative ABC transport system ATP-binding protein